MIVFKNNLAFLQYIRHTMISSCLHGLRAGLRRDPLAAGGRDDARGRALHRGGLLHDGRDDLHLPPLQAQAAADGHAQDTRTLRHVRR